jgi:hypothetical protein
VIAGLLWALGSTRRASCFGDHCRGDVAGFTARFDANAGLGGLLLVNSWPAFFVAVALAVTTLVVETVLLVRRHERRRIDC